MMAVWIGLVFVSAGRWDWVRGWITISVYVLGMVMLGAIVKLKNPALMAARANWRRADTKTFDKFFLRLFLPLTFVQPAAAGLDVVRYHRPSLPVDTVWIGLLVFAFAAALITWTMVVNPFAEPTVRIQNDRGHHVITSGPYRFVRHPMYAATILMYPAISLMFGSTWALAVSGVIIAGFIIRTVLEDRTLRQELPGYEAFASRTRYRLIPGIW